MNINHILEIDNLANLEVLAGHKGLVNEVESVSVLEIPNSQLYIKQGELLITAFFSIKDEIEQQEATIRMLKEAGASGLILAHVGVIMLHIDQRIINLCEGLELPLLKAPKDLAYIDIISPILDQILTRKNKELEKVVEIQNLISNVSITDNSSENLLNTLSNILDDDVYYIDINGLIHQSATKRYQLKQSDLSTKLQDSSLDKKDVIKIQDEIFLNYPIINEQNFYGSLLFRKRKAFNKIEEVAIQQVESSLIRSALNKVSKLEYNNRLRSEMFNELLFSKEINTNLMKKRAEYLNINLQEFIAIIVLDLKGFNILANQTSEVHLSKYKEEVVNRVKEVMPIASNSYIMTQMSDKVIILLKHIPTYEDEYLIDFICDSLLRKLISHHNIEIRIGYSRGIESIETIKHHYDKAMCAIKITKKLSPDLFVTDYEEIFIYDQLSKKYTESDVAKIKDSLSPLIEYDKYHHNKLIDTLYTLIRFQGNVSKTSEVMYLHRNTINQRIAKIEELLGVNPLSENNIMRYTLLLSLYKLNE
ncbi:PucR family transcriptional regulator ligand-binding domain-containing protein [Facklamia sp. DSM 111018]|uniref:PucR family transcriptional regulator ligand-binding domain-containing protein n=1 Tax=Facklamia lactis TaxID=2749967 RepID=A0ABS0LS92_9LACT|nr:PucR family transcriptional regulator [Facklamia lactis]MBG9981073.1 PucR family transcriptional regulator ligand-binding domain-containing protein [Facklamia lactis]MBG9986874.1 PucR family transcriptional regulator ligand-binding domain-containing protein [Facklamia lactis]